MVTALLTYYHIDGVHYESRVEIKSHNKDLILCQELDTFKPLCLFQGMVTFSDDDAIPSISLTDIVEEC